MAERTEDLNLPATVVGRIMKDALADGVKISGEAKVAITRAATVFALFATSNATEKAVKSKRKTLAAADIFEAMRAMEFEEFVEPIKQSLEEWKATLKKKKKSAKTASSQDGNATADEDIAEVEEIHQSPKKSRLEAETAGSDNNSQVADDSD